MYVSRLSHSFSRGVKQHVFKIHGSYFLLAVCAYTAASQAVVYCTIILAVQSDNSHYYFTDFTCSTKH